MKRKQREREAIGECLKDRGRAGKYVILFSKNSTKILMIEVLS